MKDLKIEPEKLREEGSSVWRSVQVEPTILDEKERRVRGIVSTDQVDAYNTVVNPNGAQVSGYMNYGSVLFNHDSGSLIGNAEEVVQREGGIEAEWRFLPEGVSDLADQVWDLYKGGWLNGYSIGFVPLEWEDKDVDGLDVVEFTKWEMKEFSVTSVPANAGALARNSEALSKFRDVQKRGSSSVFLNVQPRERDHDYEKSVTITTTSNVGDWPDDWDVNKNGYSEETRTVPSYQDHPIMDANSWDESKARDQIAEYAGGPDKEDINWNQYKKGFFYYDSSDSENKGSYKLPYCYVQNGSLKAADEGIYTVAQYLSSTDISSDDKGKVRSQLEKYYSKMDETAPWNEDNKNNNEVFDMEEKEMNSLAEKFGEEFSERMEDILGELNDKDADLDNLETRLSEAEGDAEDAWAKADRFEDDLTELEKEVEVLTKAVNKIVDKLSS